MQPTLAAAREQPNPSRGLAPANPVAPLMSTLGTLMSPHGYAALFFTVVLLVTTAYFLMGGLPLLILAHDTPVDERFIRRFFDIYYKAAIIAATGALVSYALWGRMLFAIGNAAIVALAVLLRRRIIPAMERLGARIQANDAVAIRNFRKVHASALLVNFVQLVALVWGLTRLSL
jgi:hypothetical protein